MPTKFYFHNATNNLAGTLPAGEQATATPSFTSTGAATNRLMDLGIGTAQASITGTTSAVSTLQNGLLGMWISPAVAAGTIGGGTINFSIAGDESNAASNFWQNSLNIYVWRPSTGAKVGTIRDSTGSSLGGAEVGTGETVVYISGITSSAVTTQLGDVIVVEIWSAFTQSMATSYTINTYFDGTTENITPGAGVTNHAGYILFAETLALAPIVLDITGNSTTLDNGTFTPGIGRNITSTSATGTIGNELVSINVGINGNSSAGNLNSIIPSQLVNRNITAVSSSTSTNSLLTNVTNTVSVLSNSSTGTVGAVLRSMTTGVLLSPVSGSLSAGNLPARLSVLNTGVISIASVGSLSKTIRINLLGNSANVTTVNELPSIRVNISGISSTSSVNSIVGIRSYSISGTLALNFTNVLVSRPLYTPSNIFLLPQSRLHSFIVGAKYTPFPTSTTIFGTSTGYQTRSFYVANKSYEFIESINRNLLLN